MSEAPKFTQSMTLHLNGESKFSELHYDIFRDGQKTAVTRHTRTNGRPQYRKTEDFFVAGDNRFDMLATHGRGLSDWLREHATPVPSREAATLNPQESAAPASHTTLEASKRHEGAPTEIQK